MRVVLRAGSGRVYRGWALNVSRGGIRVILEDQALAEKLELGSEFDVTLTTGADPASSCKGRLVWVQKEPDGIVCGLQIQPSP
jgi:hypothetical protein